MNEDNIETIELWFHTLGDTWGKEWDLTNPNERRAAALWFEAHIQDVVRFSEEWAAIESLSDSAGIT